MKRSEYERRRRALEETFESELAMLRAAHEVRMRSLEELWLVNPEEDAPSPALAVPPVPAEDARFWCLPSGLDDA